MVLGPGGSGVSTLAAAGALELARAAAPARGSGPLARADTGGVLLVSVDPRSDLPRRLGVFRVPGQPVPVTGELDLLHLDPLAVTETAWSGFTGALAGVGAARSLPLVGTLTGVDAGELTGLPGISEFLLLRAIRDAATSGRWQRVVVDLSGAGDPFAVLRSPTVLATAIDRLWPRHRRLAEAAEKPALAQIATAVEGIDRDCQDLRELIADSHEVSVHLVGTGGQRGLARIGDDVAAADVMGLPLRSVLVNAGSGGLPTEAVLDRARGLLGPDAGSAVSMVTIGRRDEEPVRLSRLRKLRVVLPAPNGRPRAAAAPVVEHVGGEGLDAEYRLSWRQALPDPEQLALGRSGDDLLVTIAGFRQPVRLPSVLRRCQVTAADWDGARLSVGFRPDPAVWPQR
ncbi:ArsA-related P-loop ATPase [Gordonia sp. FQ]|uniref:ArsA family ATPase n=1 Tax=Gordonia sp. FQ TaxID=3446634 RepID=UPI003F86727F